MMKKLTWGAVGSALLVILGFAFSEFGVTLYDRITNQQEVNTIHQEIVDFSKRSYIESVESKDGKTKITYHTCYPPKQDYYVTITINGNLKYKSKTFAAEDFSSYYTDNCISWSGKEFDFEFNQGDTLIVVWNYGEYGSFEMIYR